MSDKFSFVMKPVINDGALELIKWMALIIMVIDHYNKYIYGGTVAPMFQLGRLAMPLFAMAFAYNLSRPHITTAHINRITVRLIIVGLIAQVPFHLLGGGSFDWFPVNILFLFVVSVLIIQQLKRDSTYSIFLALLIFVCLGFFVEYAWFGVALVVNAWAFFTYRKIQYLAGLILSCFLLVVANSNYFALLAIPLFFLLARININFPRWRNAFYVFYPAHLWVLYLM